MNKLFLVALLIVLSMNNAFGGTSSENKTIRGTYAGSNDAGKIGVWNLMRQAQNHHFDKQQEELKAIYSYGQYLDFNTTDNKGISDFAKELRDKDTDRKLDALQNEYIKQAEELSGKLAIFPDPDRRGSHTYALFFIAQICRLQLLQCASARMKTCNLTYDFDKVMVELGKIGGDISRIDTGAVDAIKVNNNYMPPLPAGRSAW